MSYSIKFPMRKKYRFLSLTGAVIHLPHARTSTHQERDLPPPPIDPASWCPPPSPARSPLTAALHPPPAACSLLRPQRSPAAAIDVPSELSPAPRRRAPSAAGPHHLLLLLPTPAAVSQPAPTPARANAHASPACSPGIRAVTAPAERRPDAREGGQVGESYNRHRIEPSALAGDGCAPPPAAYGPANLLAVRPWTVPACLPPRPAPPDPPWSHLRSRAGSSKLSLPTSQQALLPGEPPISPPQRAART